MSAVRTPTVTFLLVPVFVIVSHTCNATPQFPSAFWPCAAVVFTTTVFALHRVTEYFFAMPDRDPKGDRNRL
jgi:hypothetical protein